MSISDEGRKLEQDAEKLAREHPQQADKAIDEAGSFAEKESGGRFDKQIEGGEQKAEQFLTGGQQGGQQGGGQQ